MNRDLAVPLLLLLLLLLVLPSTGLVPAVGGWPRTPDAFLAFALVLATFFALLVTPWLDRTGPLRVLAILVAAGPFLAYGLLASPRPPDAFLLPGPGVWIVGVASVVVAGLPRHRGRIVAVCLLAWIAGDLLLGHAGRPLLPDGFNPVTSPVVAVGSPPVGIVEPRPTEPPRIAIAGPLTPPAWEGREVAGATLVAWPYEADVDPVLLDALAGLVVIPEAHDASWWALASQPVASYVRRGGVLVGPAPGRDWPEPLGRLLGAAGRARGAGATDARAFGLGLVLRAGGEEEILEALRWGLAQPRLTTVFDQSPRVPPLPSALARWRDDPASRRSQGLLLLVYAVVAAALDRILRGRGPRLIGLLAPSVALVLALAWTAARDGGVRVHALALDLGGGGGRRVEVLALSAGPEGWAGRVRWGEAGSVRLLGARADAAGRVLVMPHGVGWVVKESVSTGAGRPPNPDPHAGFLYGLLRGPVGRERTELGRGGMLPAAVEGAELPSAWVLRWR